MRFKREYLVESILLSGITIVYLVADFQMWEYERSIFSVADSWLIMMQPLEYTLLVLPILMVGTVYDTRNDFLSGNILRYQSKKKIFGKQWKNTWLRSVWYTVVYLTLILIFGRAKGLKLCNWDQSDSLFARNNNCIYQGSFLEIFLVLFFLCVIRNIFVSTMILLSKWYLKNVLTGFLFPVSICIFEMCQSALNGTEQLNIFLRRFMADYPFWVFWKVRAEMILVLMVYGLLFAFATINILKKKEFLNGKKL